MNRSIAGCLLALAALMSSGSLSAQPAPDPVTFQFTFCANDAPATATGYITLDRNQFDNPFDNIPYSGVLALGVTVSNASFGNGTFDRSDFFDIAWSSNGRALDLSRELVGQPTRGLKWGTQPSSGEAGDFNLFSFGEVTRLNSSASRPPGAKPMADGVPPNGVFYFLLAADGGESMSLRTMAPGPAAIGRPSCPPEQRREQITASIPVLGLPGKLVLVLLFTGLAGFGLRRYTNA